jgi:hypothetical protein
MMSALLSDFGTKIIPKGFKYKSASLLMKKTLKRTHSWSRCVQIYASNLINSKTMRVLILRNHFLKEVL